MAQRYCFKVNKDKSSKIMVDEELIEFKFINGLAKSQKVKCALSLHKSINELHKDAKILECSTRSTVDLGLKLSGFNLMIDGHPFENFIQASKVFEDNVQYENLLNEPSNVASSFIHNLDKELIGFRYKNIFYPLEPVTLFYNYFYIKSMMESDINLDELMNYDIFTDIEFNHHNPRFINCQARAVAIYVSLRYKGLLDEAMKDIESFKKIVY